jgi:hypothetical protein
MSDEKRTFEANIHLHESLRLQARQAKGKKLPKEFVPDGDMNELSDGNSMPISQELILRLIRLLKES